MSKPQDTSSLKASLQRIVEQHRQGDSALRVSLALAHRLDALLQTSFKEIGDHGRQALAIVALGGYGRRELSFHSDVDVMLLVKDESGRKQGTAAGQRFLHTLLDHGLDLGHSFRTVDECLQFLNDDIEVFFSLLEARFVCGNKSLFEVYRKEMRSAIRGGDRKQFMERVTTLVKLRHDKYGNSTKLLEPNIKNSAGGLRDVHTILWLLRGTGIQPVPARLLANETAITHLLKSSIVRSLFSETGVEDIRRSFKFLLRTRNEMHLEADSLRDTLEFNFQIKVAHGLGYKKTADKSAVERFMQEYYSATRTVAAFTQRVLAWTYDRYATNTRAESCVLDDVFSLRTGKIVLRKRRRTLSNEEILRALLFAREHRAEFSFQLEDTIHRQLHRCEPLTTQKESELFRQWLNTSTGVAPTIRRVNDLGLLDRWLPEWKPLVSFFQHNQYHFYTADEHTLAVLHNAEQLSTATTLFGETFRSLPRHDVLYLACLLHDIAKPVRIGDHEIVGVGMAEQILDRLSYHDALPDVTFLIRNHLVMEQIAFRRNLNDPQTIGQFAALFERPEQLDYLFVLTFADLSAVNKNVWNDWKELLLTDLYRKTRRVLLGQLTPEEIRSEAQQHMKDARKRVVASLAKRLPQEVVERHLNSIENGSYLASFSSDEIAEHIRAIRSLETTKALFNHWSDVTEITIIANDAPYVLAKCCGVLSANDANILDAQIFTRSDGIILDKFRVNDFIAKESLKEDQCRKIATEMHHVFEGRLDIKHLMQQHRMKWKRRIKTPNPNIRVDVEFEDHPHFTIIDVYAADTLGFLYRITDTMSRLGLNISFAKIATRVDGIVDSFYVLNSHGKKLTDDNERAQVKEALLIAIRELAESELVLT